MRLLFFVWDCSSFEFITLTRLVFICECDIALIRLSLLHLAHYVLIMLYRIVNHII